MQEKVNFKAEIANFQFVQESLSVTVAGQTYKFEPDINKAYFQFDMLSSYPTVNNNKMTFMLPVLAKSFPTAMHNPLDLEHILEGNPEHALYDPDKDNDAIVGAMILSYLPGIESLTEIPLIPDAPIPMRMVGVLWKRLADARGILAGLINGEKWGISMEVIRDVAEDLYVDPKTNTFYTKDAVPSGLDVALAIGGRGDGESTSVNFWGAGLTMRPADKTANILQLTAAVGGEITMTKPSIIGATSVVIETNGKKSGTTLKIGGQPVDFAEFYCSTWEGDEKVHLSITRVVDVGDGFVVRQNYELKDESGIAAVKEGEMPVTMDMDKIIASIRNELKATEFKDYKSPAEVATVIAETEAKYKDYVAPDKVQEKVDAALAAKKAEIENSVAGQYEVFSQRVEKLEKAGLAATQTRKDKIRACADDVAFDAYLAQETASLEAMKSELPKNKVTPEVLTQIASFDGKDDPAFKSFVSGLNMAPAKASDDKLTVHLPGGGGGNDNLTGCH
jgi:hypothetical protein